MDYNNEDLIDIPTILDNLVKMGYDQVHPELFDLFESLGEDNLWNCKKCSAKRKIGKCIKIYRPPKYLIIQHLSEFSIILLLPIKSSQANDIYPYNKFIYFVSFNILKNFSSYLSCLYDALSTVPMPWSVKISSKSE